MSDITFDDSGWKLIESDVRDDENLLDEATRKNTLKASFSMQRAIKIRMPVDTGAARSSWGAKGEAGVWEVKDEGFTITQGSKLPYIGKLNEGSSTQAPAGFLDVEEEKAVSKFIDWMAKDMVKIIGS